jgi:hypothetical protein
MAANLLSDDIIIGEAEVARRAKASASVGFVRLFTPLLLVESTLIHHGASDGSEGNAACEHADEE